MALGQGRHVWNVSQLATCPDLNPVMNQRVRCSLACSLKQEEIDGHSTYRPLGWQRDELAMQMIELHRGIAWRTGNDQV
jgi:hypothetical protein